MNTKTLSNGAVYDMDKKRIVKGATLSSDTAREMVQARVQKKREVIAQSAQEAVENGDLTVRYGAEAWLAEVTQAQMRLATTPDAGKASTLAATWLVDNTGMSEKHAKEGERQGDTNIILLAVAELARRSGEVVDAELEDV